MIVIEYSLFIIMRLALSKKSVNFEEHGFLVTTAEIIIKKYKPTLKQDGNDTLELFIPF